MAIAFRAGQKFRFANDPSVYTFISIIFEDNEPIIIYANEDEEEFEAHGFYLSDLISA